MAFLGGLNLLFVGVAIAAIAILGFAIFFNNRSSYTNRIFLLFSLAAICWNVSNYLAYQFSNLELVLWMLRLVLFFAVWYTFFLYKFFSAFPADKKQVMGWEHNILIPLVVVSSLITLTPIVLTRINQLPSSPAGGQKDEVGLGIILFGVVVLALMVTGVVRFISKMRKSVGESRIQFIYVFIGTLITFSLYILFNFALPVFFGNISFIPLGAIFTFPLVALTAYAIIKHHLLNVKVISTEILTFVLAVVTFAEVILSRDPIVLLFRSVVFILVLVFGILLIRSVLREVEQREKMEKLSKELELANAELKRLDESKSEFISIASHQLRTPLTIIKGFISMINEGSFGRVPAKIREQLVKVFASNERLISLVEDLLNLSRIESGRQEYKWQASDLVAIAGSVVENLTKNASAKGLKLKLIAPTAAMPAVVCDGDKLHEVLMNFVDNAIKYTPAGGVTVSVSAKPEGMVTVAVKDTGMGIAKENLGMLFQKFSRVKGSFLVQPGGSGLGLYVAKKIVDVHEGRIWAESAGEGKGTTFAFSLPIAGPRARPEAKPKLPTPLPGSTAPAANQPAVR